MDPITVHPFMGQTEEVGVRPPPHWTPLAGALSQSIILLKTNDSEERRRRGKPGQKEPFLSLVVLLTLTGCGWCWNVSTTGSERLATLVFGTTMPKTFSPKTWLKFLS